MSGSISDIQQDITPDQNGAVLKQIIKAGKYKGNAILDDDVLIHVVGWLKDGGKEFFNTRKLQKAWKTKLESAELPAALDIAIRTMKRHEIARITCTPEYCYKDVSYKQKDFVCEVPANSHIVFEVELVNFRFYDLTEDKHSGVMLMRRLEKGQGYFYPTYASEVCCDISSYDDYKGTEMGFGCMTDDGGWHHSNFQGLIDIEGDDHSIDEVLNGNGEYSKVTRIHSGNNELTLMRGKSLKFIEKSDVTWMLGEGAVDQIPKGVEIAVENMLVGEKALFMVRYDYLKEMLTDEEYAEYEKNSEFYTFIITLKACTKAKEYYEMSNEELVQEGLASKLKGNLFLTEKLNVELAVKRYKHAIGLLEVSKDLYGEENGERDEVLLACYLNICKAYFDAKTPELCQTYVNKALEMQPQNEKAMYRNALLFMERKKYGEAKTHFENLLKQYPSNKPAIKWMNECDRKTLEQSSVEQNMYKKMSSTLFD